VTRPSTEIIVLTIATLTLAAMRLWTLAAAVALVGPVLFAARVFRIVRRSRRARLAPLADVANEACASGSDGKAVTTGHAVRDGRMAAESVVRAVQLARAEIAHAGAAEARAVLDELEHEAREHPEGLPGAVVAEARMRFDEIMRRNLQ
jgi:hypothetical protein